jgi:hypothetical protein
LYGLLEPPAKERLSVSKCRTIINAVNSTCSWKTDEQSVERECSAQFGFNIWIVFSHHVNLIVRP